MLPEDISEYWHGLQSQQTDWAFRAYARLIGTLSEDVQEKLRLKEDVAEPYVVIFGKTQVGKTTLLLDLMGIDNTQMRCISEVLRGGREQGKSATATATEYCASPNQRWGLSIQSKTLWFDSDNAVTQELGRLREAMESGNLVADSPCVMHIPKRFFAEATTAAPSVRILDLPGDNPANEKEQHHVDEMAKTYLPFADLILLVGRGDDLGFLRPEVIKLPGIEDWQSMPHRFRIVTTYSYTAQSVKDIIRNDVYAGASLLRRRLIQEIERFGFMSEAARSEELYFPLEFGNSWMGVQASDPALYKRMSPIITQLRSELLEQIRNSTTQLGRLRSTLNTHQSVKYIKKKKTDAIEFELKQLEERGKEITGELNDWKNKITQAESKNEKFHTVLNADAVIARQSIIKSAAKNPIFKASQVFPPGIRGFMDRCKTLKNRVSDYYQVLQGMQLDVKPGHDASNPVPYWIQVRNHIKEPKIDDLRGILDQSFSSIRIKLSNYKIDTYIFSSNYKEDYHKVTEAGNDAKSKIENLWMGAWLTALNNVDTIYREDHRMLQFELEVASMEYDRSCTLQAQVEGASSKNRIELNRIVSTSQEDLERCDRFVQFLDEEYLAALSKKMDRVLNIDDNSDALLQLLSCFDLKNQREELMELKNKSRIEL